MRRALNHFSFRSNPISIENRTWCKALKPFSIEFGMQVMNRKNSNRNSRQAFTLVELLVTIAIVGVLISLLLPAVQSAREAARLNACKNNLRQLGLAMHNYESTFLQLPPGYSYSPAASGNQLGHGWAAHLLPFLEQQTLYDQLDFRLPIFHPNNQLAREKHLEVFLCPTDDLSTDGFIAMGSDQFAMACYVANFGPPDLDADQEQRDGVFSRNSATKLRQITDGLSNTLMVGERQNGPFRAGRELNNHFEYETTWAASVRDIDDPTDDHGHMTLFQTGHTPNGPDSDDRDVSAAHRGLAQFLWCDGSVKVVAEEIDLALYTSVSTKAGDETHESL